MQQQMKVDPRAGIASFKKEKQVQIPKLTKEQAEHLISLFTCYNIDYDHGADGAYFKSTIKEVINQCTENMFPGIQLEDINGSHFLTISSGRPISSEWAFISSGSGNLNVSGVKHLIQSLEKIVEWMEENAKVN